MIMTRPHERFSSVVALSPEASSAFARAIGDHNPIHHDASFAAESRYGRCLASGAETTGHLMALTATHFSQRGAMVGIEFWFAFRRPVFADETVSIEWLVVAVKDNARHRAQEIDLRGRLRTAAGKTAVGAKGKVLVAERL
jgi:acyl dehydratase